PCPVPGPAARGGRGRLGDAATAASVSGRFAEPGRGAGDGLNPLLAAARGHPQRAMLLAHRLWEQVAEGEAATFADWEAAHEATLAELQPELEAEWRSYSTSEQKAPRAVIDGRRSPLPAGAREPLARGRPR